MLKLKTIADGIQNLTDARYFAAWGVDYLSFHFDPDSSSFLHPAKASEIIEWVEGPQILINLGPLPIKAIQDVFDLSLASAIIASEEQETDLMAFPVYSDFASIKAEDKQAIIETQSLEPGAYEQHDKALYILSEKPLAVAQTILENEMNLGLVLKGGSEEKIGLKNFDDLDQIFDLLLD